MILKNISLLVIITSLFYININAQDKVKPEALDKIFEGWQETEQPGVAAGVIFNGEVVYLKGFGNADVQHNIKITPQTKFQMDDLAKQFTVLAILILEKEGNISFDDDIRKYIPELPNYKYPIKIKHLLNHSSGLNNLNVLKGLSGYRYSDVFTQMDALQLIRSQKQLNSTPGTVFSYLNSDSEGILLVKIIEEASKKTFIEYTSDKIFSPLQMTNTTFNNERDLLDNVATSYQVGEQLRHDPINDLTLGVSNLYSSAEDIAKWYISFTKPSALKQLINKLDTYVTLDNGQAYNSSWGKMTYGRYFEHSERGISKMWQYGLAGGYAVNMFRFRTEELTTFVLGNNNRYNGSLAMQMANQYLEDKYTDPPTIDFSKVKIKKVSNKKLQKLEGFYWDEKNGISRQIYLKDDTLRYRRLESNRESLLLPLGENKFQFYVNSDDKIILDFNNETRTFSVVVGESDAIMHSEYKPKVYSSVELDSFTGTFYSKELDVVYTFVKEKDTLVSRNIRTGTTHFYPLKTDIFRSNTLILSSIKYMRNAKNEIIGYAISTDGVKALYFHKVNF